MQNLIEAHNRVKDFDWEPSYASKPDWYPTKYKIPAKTKDPFRHLIRDYLSMEEEKDNRQYGSMEDALARGQVSAKAEPRWMEAMKAALPILNFGEYAAMKNMGQLIETINNAELRQGYLAQMLDEVRHTNQEAYLSRYFARHAADPEGFTQGFKLRGTNIFNRAARAAFEAFFVGDPIEGALNLQVVAETAYTNSIFVALTEIAAANGDQVTPSVFLSIQSDESRHMANGYSTLAAVVSNPDNLPALQIDFDRAFWRQHAFIDSFLSVVWDYFQTNRSFSYLDKWREWIDNDWVGSYIERLAPFGLKVPSTFAAARDRVPWMGHSAAMVGFAAWPLQYWRFDPLTNRDMDWFELKYPGWHGQYGKFWDEYRRRCDPRNGELALSMFPSLPPLCRVCQMPCVFPRPDISTCRIKEFAGKRHAFCTPECELIFDQEPHRYLAYDTFYELFDGYDLADFIVENGLLRADGKTLIAQPWLNQEQMWTIDHIRAARYEIRDPLRQQ
ncbi:MAG: monooxygenase [Candidatus Binataceae bacterium]|nr:monooxygenase [Candidatus Binataceae bacterium]